MLRSMVVLLTVFLCSSTAFAGLCENAVRGFERRAATAKKRCDDQTQIKRLQARLTKATSPNSIARIQTLITNAQNKQKIYCDRTTAALAAATKIKDFCSRATGDISSYCKFGYSLRVKGTEASSRCKRGRLWTAPTPNLRNQPSKCYFIEEYFFTSVKEWGDSKSTSRGEILYADRPTTREGKPADYWQINLGYLLDAIKKQEECI